MKGASNEVFDNDKKFVELSSHTFTPYNIHFIEIVPFKIKRVAIIEPLQFHNYLFLWKQRDRDIGWRTTYVHGNFVRVGSQPNHDSEAKNVSRAPLWPPAKAARFSSVNKHARQRLFTATLREGTNSDELSLLVTIAGRIRNCKPNFSASRKTI